MSEQIYNKEEEQKAMNSAREARINCNPSLKRIEQLEKEKSLLLEALKDLKSKAFRVAPGTLHHEIVKASKAIKQCGGEV